LCNLAQAFPFLLPLQIAYRVRLRSVISNSKLYTVSKIMEQFMFSGLFLRSNSLYGKDEATTPRR
jgi:hypothetical protein